MDLHTRPLLSPGAQRRGPSPSQLIALSFLAAIALGTLLLALPAAHAPGRGLSWLEALFTATSAVCVTGLTVVDTADTFSLFGELVLALLIQVGGLGILTLGTLVALISGRRIGLRERLNLQTQVNALQLGGVVRLLRAIALFVLVSEAVGALLLYPAFRFEGAWRGAGYALFHAVSAFNNAGFALYPDNLVRFAGAPWLNAVVMALVVLGGLGFTVVVALAARLRFRLGIGGRQGDGRGERGRAPLSLHARLVLGGTALLLGGGAALLLALEWSNPATLGALPLPDKLLAGVFAAVTPRTAGFNTLDYGAMRPASLLFTMLLMFIGGNPGSTAGGIKTVTFLVLVGSAWSISRGRGELTLFGRRVALTTLVRAGVIALLSTMLIGAATTLLTLTEPGRDPLALAFETVSAVGTVGLSTGITAELSPASQLLLIALMYLGRLGPLTVALALVARPPDRSVAYPTEEILIG